MEDPLIKNCEITSEEGEGQEKIETQKTPFTPKIKVQNPVHPLSGGAVSCLLAVDNVVRATADFGTPRKISLAPPPPTSIATDSAWESDESDALFLPLQNTRHLFVREYKKPLKWPNMQATKKFQVLNSNGDCIYYAAEESSFLSKFIFFRGILPFKINVISVEGEPVMEIQGRPFFKNCITIKDSRDQLIGKIKKVHNRCSKSYLIKTWDGTEILNIQGPDGSNCCCLFGCGNADFDVNLGVGTTSIGKISAEWEYALEDMCGIFVPMKCDELTMSLLLGAVFLIDFNYYQRKKDVSCFGRCFLTMTFFTLFILLLFLISKK